MLGKLNRVAPLYWQLSLICRLCVPCDGTEVIPLCILVKRGEREQVTYVYVLGSVTQ